MNQDLPNGHDKRRAINVIPFGFNPDGSIPNLPHSKAGIVKALKNLDPYSRVQAETIAWSEGLKTTSASKTGVYVTGISNGDYIKVRSVDFGKGAKIFEASVASASGGGKIEIHLGTVDGTLLGTCEVKNTGGWQNWAVQSCTVTNVKGVYDVYFVFKGRRGRFVQL